MTTVYLQTMAAGPMEATPPAAMPNLAPAKPANSAAGGATPSSPSSNATADSIYSSGSIEYEEHVPDTSKFPKLDVLNALNTALIESPRAAAIRSQFGITQAGYAQVTQVPNPVFFFDRGMVAEQENRIGPVLSPEPPWKLIFRFIVQKNTVDQARFDLLAQLWQLRAAVRRAYTEVVVAQETLKALDELYDLSARLETVVRKRFQAGAVPELDVMKTHLALSQTGVDRIVGVQRVIKARQGLNVILGRAVDAPYNVAELPDYTGGNAIKFEIHAEKNDMLPDFSKPVEPLSYYLAIAESSRLELKSLYQQQRLNNANLQAAYGNIIPNPSIAFGKSEQGNVPTGPKVTAVFFTLNVAGPSTNTNQGAIATYKATAKQLRYQILSQKNQIMSDVSAAYQSMLASRDKLRTYQEHILADSYQVARLARRSYEVGQSDITATLAAQQANVQTRSAYLDAVTTYENSFTDLEQACGMPLQ